MEKEFDFDNIDQEEIVLVTNLVNAFAHRKIDIDTAIECIGVFDNHLEFDESKGTEIVSRPDFINKSHPLAISDFFQEYLHSKAISIKRAKNISLVTRTYLEALQKLGCGFVTKINDVRHIIAEPQEVIVNSDDIVGYIEEMMKV